MGSSGLDAPTLVSDEADGNQLACSLLSKPTPSMLELACSSRPKHHPNATPTRGSGWGSSVNPVALMGRKRR